MSGAVAARSAAALRAEYVELPTELLPRGTRGVALAPVAGAIASAVGEGGTLHGWASFQPGRREMRGRGVAWAVRLPDGSPVVVRHSQHGGLLAPLTGDMFLPPTRAPAELTAALRLTAASVPTPRVVAYVTYPATLPPFRRADVATAEVVGGRDLPAALGLWPGARTAVVRAVALLIARLGGAGARHPDLNVKNVLITMAGPAEAGDAGDIGDTGDGADAGARPALAHVLDVDRVIFSDAGDDRVTAANLRRFTHSARRWRERRGPLLDDTELTEIERLVHREVA